MTELEKVIRGLRDIDMFIAGRLGHEKAKNFLRTIDETITLLKEQEAVVRRKDCKECLSDCFEPWDVLWKAPDGTFKGRCDNCGFVHVFIEGHATQYKFCPQCGEQKQEL